jgi:hypothetical protein
MLMNPMSTFDHDQPSDVHERLNDATVPWSPRDADKYRCDAKLESDGTVSFEGLILDGWMPQPMAAYGRPRTPQ